jgi:hypothetical protein
MVLKIKPTDQFPTRVSGLKKAVTIGLAGVTLAATLSLVAAGYASPYLQGPRIINIPEREPVSSDENGTTPRFKGAGANTPTGN